MRPPRWHCQPTAEPRQQRRGEESQRPPDHDASRCRRLALPARGAEYAPHASSTRARQPPSSLTWPAGLVGCGSSCDYITRDPNIRQAAQNHRRTLRRTVAKAISSLTRPMPLNGSARSHVASPSRHPTRASSGALYRIPRIGARAPPMCWRCPELLRSDCVIVPSAGPPCAKMLWRSAIRIQSSTSTTR